jgi:hypothetical protein
MRGGHAVAWTRWLAATNFAGAPKITFHDSTIRRIEHVVCARLCIEPDLAHADLSHVTDRGDRPREAGHCGARGQRANEASQSQQSLKSGKSVLLGYCDFAFDSQRVSPRADPVGSSDVTGCPKRNHSTVTPDRPNGDIKRSVPRIHNQVRARSPRRNLILHAHAARSQSYGHEQGDRYVLHVRLCTPTTSLTGSETRSGSLYGRRRGSIRLSVLVVESDFFPREHQICLRRVRAEVEKCEDTQTIERHTNGSLGDLLINLDGDTFPNRALHFQIRVDKTHGVGKLGVQSHWGEVERLENLLCRVQVGPIHRSNSTPGTLQRHCVSRFTLRRWLQGRASATESDRQDAEDANIVPQSYFHISSVDRTSARTLRVTRRGTR